MKLFKSMFKLLIVSTIILSSSTRTVSAEMPNENTVPNEIDWDTVTEIITLYDDGSIKASSVEEALKRRELELDGKVLNLSMMSRSSNSYFSKVEWLIRSNGPTLSLTPINPWTIKKDPAFRYLQTVWLNPNHPMFKEFSQGNKTATMSMYNQFACHVDFARSFKVPWNIEPWKPDKGYWGFANPLNLCN